MDADSPMERAVRPGQRLIQPGFLNLTLLAIWDK